MGYRDKLISGLQEIQDSIIARIDSGEEVSEEYILAGGYVCGYIMNEIPALQGIPDEDMDAFDRATEEYLAERAEYAKDARDA